MHIALLTLALAASINAGDKPTAEKAVMPADEFSGKFVAVNYTIGGVGTSQVMEKVTQRRLGSRDFLVGEITVRGDQSDDWKGAVVWIPTEQIETIMVFADKGKALRILEEAQKQGERGDGERRLKVKR